MCEGGAWVCGCVRGYAWVYTCVWDELSEFLPENRVPTSADFDTYPIRIFLVTHLQSNSLTLLEVDIRGVMDAAILKFVKQKLGKIG